MTVQQQMQMTEVRNSLRDLVDRLYRDGGAVIIERSGKPMAVLLSYDNYLEVLEFLQDLKKEPAMSR